MGFRIEDEGEFMKKHQVAVVGTGFIGPVHVEALRRVGQEVVGILGSSLAKSESAAQSLGIAKAYSSFNEVLESDVEVIHIATPNTTHFEYSSKALQAGKHVMCEKPLAVTSAESKQLVDLAAAKKLAAGVNYNIRYYPLCIEARNRVQNQEVGDVISVQGSYVQDWLLYPTDYNWRVLKEYGDLRAVADIGTHWLDLVLYISGLEPTEVFADLRTVYDQRKRPKGEVQTFSDVSNQDLEDVEIGTEDQGVVLIRCTNGAQLVMWTSQMTAGRKNCLRFELAGKKSSMAWNSEEPNELWLGNRSSANQLLVRDPSLLSAEAAAFASYPGGHAEGFPDTFKQLYLDFYRYIEFGDFDQKPTFPTFFDGHREIVLCEAILKSHETRGWVTL